MYEWLWEVCLLSDIYNYALAVADHNIRMERCHFLAMRERSPVIV